MSVKAVSREIKHKINPQDPTPAFPYCTICEVHRRLHRLVSQAVKPEDPVTAIRLHALIEEAYDLGERMHHKLTEYKANYHGDILDKMRPEE